MKTRYLSLDVLRGISIFGMVFCSLIPWSVLPAWMYHIQNPPPTHEFNMTIAGLSWVDLVFPIFLFCMGVAIPFSGQARLSKDSSGFKYILHTFERFIMLWLFSYLYVFITYSNINGIWPQILTLCGFISLFPIYMVFKKPKLRANSILIRICGLIICLLIICMGHYFFGEVISIQRRGIIIFLLAFLYLFSSLIWYFTRNKPWNRIIIFALIFVFTIYTQKIGLPTKTYANPSIRWWFNIEYIYFLLLLLPSTFIGEILLKKINNNNNYKIENNNWWIFLLCLLLVIWECYAIYMRLILINLYVTFTTLLLLYFFIRKKLPQYKEMFLIASLMLIWGIIMDPLDNGLKKAPCTISYCLVTFSISFLLLMVCDYICKVIPKNFLVNIFKGAGQNPLMSYIAHGCLIVPIMKLTGISVLCQMLYLPEYPSTGVLRAAIVVLLTMWVVSLFSKRNIFWKA